MLERDLGSEVDPKVQRDLEGLRVATAQMEKIVSSVLAYAKAGTVVFQLRPTSLERVVRRALTRAGKTLTSVGASVHVGPLPSRELDAEWFGRVLDNLIDNAIRYRHPERALCIRITWSDDALRVEDNGVGIPAEKIGTIFEPFVRAARGDPNMTAGNGLGLSLCAETLRRMGGTIGVQKSDENGTTLRIRLLPVAEQA